MQDKESSARRQLMSGVAIMTLSTAIVKIIGLVYKIPMLQLLSEEGMAYFNAAYNIYVMFYMISTAGLPVAISILVSENRVHGNTKNIKKIYRVALSLFFVIGLAGTLCMLLLSSQTCPRSLQRLYGFEYSRIPHVFFALYSLWA